MLGLGSRKQHHFGTRLRGAEVTNYNSKKCNAPSCIPSPFLHQFRGQLLAYPFTHFLVFFWVLFESRIGLSLKQGRADRIWKIRISFSAQQIRALYVRGMRRKATKYFDANSEKRL